MTTILGVNGYPGPAHDAAAALIVDGRLAAAVEEERLCRRKHASGLPATMAVNEVLDVASVGLADVDAVACPWLPETLGMRRASVEAEVRSWLVEATKSRARWTPPIRFVEHHRAHAWCGMQFVPGGTTGKRVAALVVDGSGESTSGAAYVFDGLRLERLWSIAQTSSLGIYYEALSQFIGFPWGEEGKTMGLASFGRTADLPLPTIDDERFVEEPAPSKVLGDGARRYYHSLRARVMEQFGRHLPVGLTFNERADVALAGQRVVEQRLLEYALELLRDPRPDVLVFAGGVALNCAINARLAETCRERDVEFVVPPPASDTGVALGAAVAAHKDPARLAPATDAYLGRDFPISLIADELQRHGGAVEEVTSEALARILMSESRLCGWFHGRAEIGPRALGRRSILARVDSEKVRDRLNVVKGRESWRPLAPSVSPKEFRRSFSGMPSSYMLLTSSVLRDAAPRLAGVRHVDGSSRPQVVGQNDAYRALIEAVGDLTGTEAVICTSFNTAAAPLVYSPSEALHAARQMGLDLLAGDGWLLRL